MRYLFLLLVLSFSCLLFAQDYQPAYWQYLDGRRVEGEVHVLDILLIKEKQVLLKVEGQLMPTAALDFLVSEGDTLLFRQLDVYGENVLYQRIFSGAFDIYRPIGKRDSYNFVVRRPNEKMQPIQDFFWEISKEYPDLTSKRNWEKLSGDFNGSLLMAETIHKKIAPNQAFSSPLIYQRKWSLIGGINSPLSTRLVSGEKQQYWALYASVDKQLRRIANEISLQLGLQLLNYSTRGNFAWQSGGIASSYDYWWKLTAFQGYLGLNLNLLPDRQLSPFFGGGMSYLFPLQHERELQAVGEVLGLNSPLFVSTTGGMNPSLGLYYRLGLHYKWSSRIAIKAQVARDLISLDAKFKEINRGTRSLLRSQDIQINAGNWLRLELLLTYNLRIKN